MSFSHSLARASRSAGLSTFLTPREKDESGHLQHHREAELVGRAGKVVRPADDDGRRHGDAVRGHQLVQVDLVGAADHRDRIVDDRHALLHRPPGEAVGVVVDRRRLADEQRVELGEPRQVALGDRLDFDPELLGDARPMLERREARRRQLLVRIVKHGEGIARRRAVLLRAPFAPGVLVQRGVKKRELRRRQLGHRHGCQALDLRPAAILDGHLEHRAAEPVEEQPAEAVEAVVLDLAEEDQDAVRDGLVVGRGEALRPACRRARAAPGRRAGGRRDRPSSRPRG